MVKWFANQKGTMLMKGTYFANLPKDLTFDMILWRFFDNFCYLCEKLRPSATTFNSMKITGRGSGIGEWTSAYGFDILCPKCYLVLEKAVQFESACGLYKWIIDQNLANHALVTMVSRHIQERRYQWNIRLEKKKRNPRSYTKTATHGSI